jgi:hypothetical protein
MSMPSVTRSRLPRRDVLATWFGCFVGGWLGLALGYLIAIVIASSRETTGLESLSEGLLIGGLTVTLGGLGGSAAGVALSLKVLRESRPVATGVTAGLSLVITVPVAAAVGSLLGLFHSEIFFVGTGLVTVAAAFLSAEFGRIAVRNSRPRTEA